MAGFKKFGASKRVRLRRSLLAALCCALLAALLSATPLAGAQSSGQWVRGPATVVDGNPGRYTAFLGANGGVVTQAIQTNAADAFGNATYGISWEPPPATMGPTDSEEISVRLSVDSLNYEGGWQYRISPLILVNRANPTWTVFPFVDMRCSGGTCTTSPTSGTSSGSKTLSLGRGFSDGQTKTVYYGILNCSVCGIEWEYTWDADGGSQPEPTPITPRCDGKLATIVGSGLIVGTSGADVIVGSQGADTIKGRGGKDTICGLGGPDNIKGGGGGDTVFGGTGRDTISGGKGADKLNGGGSSDIIRGGPGVDRAKGGSAWDLCAAERESSCEDDPPIAGPLVEWTVRPRYGERDEDRAVRPTRKINPKFYKADFKLRRGDGSPCKSTDKVKTSGARFSTPNKSKPCELVGRFDAERTFQVTFTLSTKEGKGLTIEDVVIQDWLIVGIGDSNGSGEGTPDRPEDYRKAVWVNKQCHRSGNSHQALTAKKIEQANKKTSVTFRHLACSGAQIEDGLLKPYRGIVPGKKLAPQVQKLAGIQAKREVDAVIVSAGVNDLHFGEMVTFCVKWERCPERTWETFGNETLDTVMQRNLSRLPALYQQLNDQLDAAGIPSDRVYITEYFDSTTDANGTRCNPLIRFGGGLRDFDQSEAEWAATRVLRPLNQQVRAAAQLHGWNMITGAEAGFIGHGICAGNSSWIITRAQSKARQADENGTLHSTIKGNKKQRNLVYPAIVADFYDAAGNPRSPS